VPPCLCGEKIQNSIYQIARDVPMAGRTLVDLPKVFSRKERHDDLQSPQAWSLTVESGNQSFNATRFDRLPQPAGTRSTRVFLCTDRDAVSRPCGCATQNVTRRDEPGR